jgi:sterol desaturase/sphingolipid hydroxylase (fatty acid hydroxylase superfamily)
VFEWIGRHFAALQQWMFEGAVLPLVHAIGLGAYAEQAFDWTEVFLIGAIEISLLAIVLTALEKWRPVEVQPGQGKYVDVVYTLLQRLGFVPLAAFLLLMPVIDAIDGWLRMRDFVPPKLEDALPFLHQNPLASFLFYMVILDFVAYWLHRFQHRLNAWWALHALHHSQREMTFWSDNRNHLLDDIIVHFLYALVALTIGVAPAQFVTLVVVSRVVESLSHANLRVSFGRVGEYLLVSPRFHRVHHAIGFGHEGSARGCNFAVLFPVWDVIFRTADFADHYPATGVRDQLTGHDYGRGFWAQQWLGLRRMGAALSAMFRSRRV